jgi:hypothetical protein
VDWTLVDFFSKLINFLKYKKRHYKIKLQVNTSVVFSLAGSCKNQGIKHLAYTGCQMGFWNEPLPISLLLQHYCSPGAGSAQKKF